MAHHPSRHRPSSHNSPQSLLSMAKMDKRHYACHFFVPVEFTGVVRLAFVPRSEVERSSIAPFERIFDNYGKVNCSWQSSVEYAIFVTFFGNVLRDPNSQLSTYLDRGVLQENCWNETYPRKNTRMPTYRSTCSRSAPREPRSALDCGRSANGLRD